MSDPIYGISAGLPGAGKETMKVAVSFRQGGKIGGRRLYSTKCGVNDLEILLIVFDKTQHYINAIKDDAGHASRNFHARGYSAWFPILQVATRENLSTPRGY